MSIEEIKGALEKSPELKVQLISSLKDDIAKQGDSLGLVIRTKEDDEKHLEAQLKVKVAPEVDKLVKEKLDAEFAKTLGTIDAKVQEITGVQKNAGEKTTDYAARAVGEAKGKAAGVNGEKLKELEDMLAKQKNEYETKLSDLEKQSFTKEVEFQVSAFLDSANIAVPAHLKTDEERQAFVNQQRSLIKAGFLNSYTAKRDDSGNILFYEGDKPAMSSKDGKPKGAGELIGEKFGPWFMPAGHKQGGAGTGGAGGGKPEGGFKTKDDIHAHLKANGIAVGTKDYLDQFSKLAEESKIDI